MLKIIGPVLLAGLALAQERFPITVDWTSAPASESTARVTFSWEVPRYYLAFTTRADSLVAIYRLELQILGRRNEFVTGQVWRQETAVATFEETRRRTATLGGVLAIELPYGDYRADLRLADAQSAMYADTVIAIDVTRSPLIGPRFLRHGAPVTSRTFSARDTIAVEVGLPASVSGLDSVACDVIADGKTVSHQVRRIVAGSAPVLLFDLPVASLANGRYQLALTAAGSAGTFRRLTGFSVSNPFYSTDRTWRQRVEELVYVATRAQIDSLLKVPPDQRPAAWEKFWRPLDPTPQTEQNEAEEEYLARIDYCQEHFGGADRGYRSDRGRVYMKLGPPDEVESHPFDPSSQAYEVWFYYSSSQRFVFVDRNGFGEYTLVYPTGWMP